jgi:hypothetical protein
VTTVHYLQWHLKDSENHEEASDLFHRFHVDPPESVTEDEIDGLYEKVAEVDVDDLEKLYQGWNRGSRQEEEEFLFQRYCERCRTYIEGKGEAINHTVQNHGYDAFTESGTPGYVRGIRSLSVGDVVEQDETLYACISIGWQELELFEGGS